MDAGNSAPLSREAFAGRVATELQIADVQALLNESFETLGLDSIHMLELDLLVEELGVHLTDDCLVRASCLGDIYDEYVTRCVPPA